MAEYFNISKWNEKPWYQTGGTRNKVIVENPENGLDYFFKTSLKKVKLDYKYEFWSEIIASEVGILLGFNMLEYDIAFNRGEIGCLSKSMITEGKSTLNEGYKYLKGFDTTYNPDEKNSKSQYSFQLIKDALQYFRAGQYLDNIIEIIIIDSIIGNGDRHQENWGIISDYEEIVNTLKQFLLTGKKNLIKKSLFYLLAITSITKRNEVENVVSNLSLVLPGKFSKIYDSGSCLGRELDEIKIKLMLKDKQMMDAYIMKGTSEIHWNGRKLNHFDLIKQINKLHPKSVNSTVERVVSNFNFDKIAQCVNNIDNKLPDDQSVYKLPDYRKEFIIKLITLRFNKLSGLIS